MKIFIAVMIIFAIGFGSALWYAMKECTRNGGSVVYSHTVMVGKGTMAVYKCRK